MDMHASCAARDGAGVLLIGPPGAGKSDMLLRLLDLGFTLVADDRVRLSGRLARAHPGFEGQMEARGLGIVKLPFEAAVEVRLAVELLSAGMAAVRLPEPRLLEGLGIPLVSVDPRPASAALLVRLALDCVLGRARALAGALAA